MVIRTLLPVKRPVRGPPSIRDLPPAFERFAKLSNGQKAKTKFQLVQPEAHSKTGQIGGL